MAQALAGHWLISDVDDTLIARPPRGPLPTLRESPAHVPLLRFLELGGSLLLVTAVWWQVVDCIPQQHRERVWLSTSGGANLVQATRAEDVAYRLEGAPGGTVVPQEHVPYLVSTLHSCLLSALGDMARGGTRAALAALPLGARRAIDLLLEGCGPCGGTGAPMEGAVLSAALPLESLTTPGAFAEGEPPVIACAGPPGAVCSVSALGLTPASVRKYLLPLADALEEQRGVKINLAPSSVWLTRAGVDKRTPVEWLERRGLLDVRPGGSAVVFFGDAPLGNDGPLAKMAADRGVGGFEKGTAMVITRLLSMDPATWCSGLADVADAVRKELVDIKVRRKAPLKV
eukprot:m51a1_g12401 hypothetical protein (344) ;mRNA; r:688504-689798